MSITHVGVLHYAIHECGYCSGTGLDGGTDCSVCGGCGAVRALVWMAVLIAVCVVGVVRFGHHIPGVNAQGAGAMGTIRTLIGYVTPAMERAGRWGGLRMSNMTSAAAQAIAAHWLRTQLGNMPHAGDPELVGKVWRVPIHADFPVPRCTDVLPFRNLGEIVIDAESGEVVGFPTSRVRESRTAEEIGRILGEIQNEIQPFECERCGRCCGPLGATAVELDIIDRHVQQNNIEVPGYSQITLSNTIMRTTDRLQCPYLKDHECLVYPVRPTICRLFGTSTQLIKCASGCKSNEPITHEAAFHILRRVDVLSTLWTMMVRHGLEVDA